MANISSSNSLGERVPKLRFPEFEGEWEKCKVAQIFRRIQMPVDVEEAKSYIQIGIRSHGKGLFYKEPVLGEELGNKRVFWIEPNCFIVNIVFAWERAVAKTTISENGLIASHRFPMYKPISEIVNLDYVTIYFITKYGQKILELASPGGAGRNKTLGQNEFLNSFIVIPKIKEQKKIAEFIQLINKKIKIQQSLVESLKLYKRGLLSKLFPQKGERVPQYRFEGFTDAWEQRKLGEIVDVYSGRDYKHLGEGTIPVYGTGGYMLSVSEALSEKDDAIGIGRKGTIDNPHILRAPFWTVDTLFYCIPKKDLDLDFVFNIFQKINWKAMDESTGVPSLSKTAINNVAVMIPAKNEQAKLGGYFANLAHLITLHQQMCSEMKSIKKCILQNMFV